MNNLMNCYAKEITLEYGKGCNVFDSSGKKYLDLIGGIATCSVGHGNAEIVKTVASQASKIINPSNYFHSEHEVKLAEKLASLSGLEKVFFCNSGTEAVEGAIKLAKKHTGKQKIIAMKNGFHGRTLGALSATWNPKYKEKFKPLVPGFEHVEFGNANALAEKIGKETAAVLLEPIQGEAGIIVPPKGYLKQVEKICKENEALLVLDEIQSGNGRTGKFFCFQHESVKPNIVAIAKGIANGLPMGAVISGNGIDFEKGDHGSTFGGNSVCCAVALKTIEIIEELMPGVGKKGELFVAELEKIGKIKEVRGKGLMLAAKIEGDANSVAKECAKKGALVNPMHGNLLRFLPPLSIGGKEILQGTKIIKGILEND